ncbi:MAG: purine-nucleoside phosphorylase [Streptosporangiales bacterium]|nr:purine-nucleoside phosphorylase [Streptosporangiales bacterium]
MGSDPYRLARLAADSLRERTGAAGYHAAVVLGSGWAPAADAFGEPAHELAVTELPGFPAPGVAGHAGRLRTVEAGGRRVLVFLGRSHLYEGHGAAAVAHGVRTALAAGVGTVILTNAAGGIRAGLRVGQPVLIADHINLTGASPLAGATFVDLTACYSPRLRALARDVDPGLAEGVYACMRGPQYETPAEIRMLHTLGADLVGMSTALEAIAAREAGAEVLGVSLVTNVAAGLSDEPVAHEEVLAVGRESAGRMGRLLAELVGKL